MTTGERVEKMVANPLFALIGRGAAVLAVGLLTWVLTTLFTLTKDLSTVTAKLEATRELVIASGQGRYTVADAKRDQEFVQAQIGYMRERIDRVEQTAQTAAVARATFPVKAATKARP